MEKPTKRQLDGAIRCKRWGHSWDEFYGPAPANVYVPGEVEFLQCERCTTIRMVELSRTTGHVVYTRYLYPRWYKELDTRLEYRKEWWNGRHRATSNVRPLRRSG